MNTIYKVIWNDALQVFQAVNEITKSHRKHSSVTGGGYLSSDLHSHDQPSTLRLKAVAIAVAGAIIQSSVLLAPTPVWAENYSINFGNGAIDLGGEPTQSEIPEIPIEEVPVSDEYFVLNSSAFQVSTGNLSAQDTNNSVANVGYVVSSTPPALGGILIQDQEGKTLYDSKDKTDRFKVSGADGIFSYKLMTSLSQFLLDV